MRLQEGSCGCRVAQLSAVIRGCAGAVRGDMFVSVGGRVSSLLGKRVGETYGLFAKSVLLLYWERGS